MFEQAVKKVKRFFVFGAGRGEGIPRIMSYANQRAKVVIDKVQGDETSWHLEFPEQPEPKISAGYPSEFDTISRPVLASKAKRRNNIIQD